MSQPNGHPDLKALRVMTAGYALPADNGGALTRRPVWPSAQAVRLLTQRLCELLFVRLSVADAACAVGKLHGRFR